MNLEELDEDDRFQVPPTCRSLLSVDGMPTERSVEAPRRAYSEMPLAKGSFGSIRMSERFDEYTELGAAESRGIGADSSGLLDGLMDVDDERYLWVTLGSFRVVLTHGSELPGDYSNAIADESGLQTTRFSDIRSRNLFHQDGDTSFAFDIPVDTAAERPILDTDEAQNDNGCVVDVSETDALEGSTNNRLAVSEQKQRPKLQHKFRNSTPSLSVGVVKKLASSFAQSSGALKSKINKKTLGAIMQANDWFFEQIGNDLGAYAEHAGRKTIDETDIIMLLKRLILDPS